MLTFREGNEADYPLLADSFWKVARHVPSCYGVGRLFLVGMLEKVIRDPKWNVTVMTDDSCPDEIIGWSIWRSPTEVFWLAVKPRYQHLGMGRALLENMGIKQHGIAPTIHAPIVPPELVPRAGKLGYRIAQRPYMAL